VKKAPKGGRHGQATVTGTAGRFHGNVLVWAWQAVHPQRTGWENTYGAGRGGRAGKAAHCSTGAAPELVVLSSHPPPYLLRRGCARHRTSTSKWEGNRTVHGKQQTEFFHEYISFLSLLTHALSHQILQMSPYKDVLLMRRDGHVIASSLLSPPLQQLQNVEEGMGHRIKVGSYMHMHRRTRNKSRILGTG
jgi:hypothetical protein